MIKTVLPPGGFLLVKCSTFQLLCSLIKYLSVPLAPSLPPKHSLNSVSTWCPNGLGCNGLDSNQKATVFPCHSSGTVSTNTNTATPMQSSCTSSFLKTSEIFFSVVSSDRGQQNTKSSYLDGSQLYWKNIRQKMTHL